MYVEKIVDEHDGNFDQVLIAGALSPNCVCIFACVCLCVCISETRNKYIYIYE